MQQNNPWSYSTNNIIFMYLQYAAKIVIMWSAVLFYLQLTGYNPSKFLSQNLIIKVIVILIIFVSIFINSVFNRNFYLPFLGQSVYPCGSLAEKVPNKADITVTVQVKPNVNVIYWASEPSAIENQPIDNPWDAYANYDNSGVVKADSTGKAVLHVRTPSSYKVGLMNKTLKSHVHYRECSHPGMLSDIRTIMI